MEKNFQKDRLLGHTSFGVHRDDYKFFFNQTDASGAASRGEVRSMILALKFIEAKQLVEKNGKKPVILLDDVFSELDEKRQKCLVKNFKDNQVIITSVNAVYESLESIMKKNRVAGIVMDVQFFSQELLDRVSTALGEN